jgi:RNA polymerase sigma factor (sigma-70 family)
MPSSISEVLDYLRGIYLRQDQAGVTDGQLLGRFIELGDEDAVIGLMRRHGPVVWGICRRLLSHHDAEDAFQATFLVLVRKAASIVPREMVVNWLFGVAHRIAKKARALQAKRRTKEREGTTMPEPQAPEPDVWNDLQLLLDQELSRLPDKYRIAILLCDLGGKTRKEAARQLGLPEGTLAGHLTRGRAMLAKRLTRRGLALSSVALTIVLTQKAASATVPTSVMSSSIKAVTSVAAGQAVATGVISAKAAALTERALKTMFQIRSKTIAIVLMSSTVVGLGAHIGVREVLVAREDIPLKEAVDDQRIPSRQKVATLRGHGNQVHYVAAFSPDDKTLASGGDKLAWREMVTMKHEQAITTIACSSDLSVAGDDGGTMFVWDTKTGKNRKCEFKLGKDHRVDRLQFTTDGKLYCIAGGRKWILHYYVKDKKLEGRGGFGGGDFDGVAMGYLGASPDGKIELEFLRGRRAVNLRPSFIFEDGKFIAPPGYDPNHFEIVEYKTKVTHALVSADNKWLAVVTEDGTLHIHDRASLRETHTIDAGKKGVAITDIQFSADGERIAIARDDALAKVYDTAKGEEVATLKGGHSGIVFAVAFGPDGKKVVTGGDDNTARVWDTATGKALSTLKGHTDSVRCAAFDPSGEILVTGSADKTVKVWRAR